MKFFPPEMQEHQFDFTPMVDVVFLLVIFFMFVSVKITDKIEVSLPFSESSRITEQVKDYLNFTITQEGGLYKETQPITLADLESLLQKSMKYYPDLKVYLRADKNCSYHRVKPVLDICRKENVVNLILGTLQE